MIKYEYIREAEDFLANNWGEDGKRVVEAAHRVTPFNAPFKKFLEHCTCCGGNWGGMFLTGIKELWPEVWDAIPNDMGVTAFGCISSTLLLCGVDTTGEDGE